ncbi:hypothetical protein [Acidiphilium sp. JA12-A1]|uniref:hypothetical protein n=1 Tax=Acidiphilium sp. JA12-A1 TaxID=1464546 RepID=UPI000461B613|nr:hypothetical protein [Acidiphilium sp. JA12-A1]KDM65109.1 hypothetical protein ACIDI_230c00020 [Acidiphilium sp. JA12-A1]
MPHPQALHLELRSLHAVYLILPTSAETREVHRFQAYQGSDTLGRLEFEQMLDAMRQGATPFFGHPGNLAASVASTRPGATNVRRFRRHS